ncbi:MAG: FAD-dependent oxidoreductase, partial [Fretibacterium sp.]|nr:FAD-dependent oxidoreductase [Fretibacterium sp.]
FARHVTILVRGDDFSCAKAVADKAREHEKITVLTNTSVEEVSGQNGLDYIRYRNSKTGEVTEFRAKEGESFGVFVFAGYAPETSLVEGVAELNEQGYIVTDRSQKTNVEGLYAAGDVCIKPLRQVVTAVGDGALAATELERYAAAKQTRTGLFPKKPQVAAPQSQLASEEDSIFDSATLAQLDAVFARMESPLELRLYLSDDEVSSELRQYMEALAARTDKLSVKVTDEPEENRPCVRLFRPDGTYTGLAFHGVPGGHEFTSFVLGLYNAAGSGQSIDEELERAARAIAKPLDMKVLVSLSCTMCPELVTAAQKIASLNDRVTAEVYDLNHFPALQKQYKVMSVPCLILNNKEVSFGKKNLAQLLELIAEKTGS